MEEIGAVFGINWKLLLIQGLNFGLLLLILWKFLYTPLVRVMTERQVLIARGVNDALDAEKKLAEIENEKSTILKQATSEGEKIIETVRGHALTQEADFTRIAQEKSERILADANLKATEIKKQAHARSKDEIARVAVLAAEKILRNKA